jgi:hypothetical protein
VTTKPTNREMAEVARKAAEIIQERGKATGVGEDDEGRVCAHGALALAQEVTAVSFVARDQVLSRIRDRVGWHVAQWSDLPTTTEADIAKVFLQVADAAEVLP